MRVTSRQLNAILILLFFVGIWTFTFSRIKEFSIEDGPNKVNSGNDISVDDELISNETSPSFVEMLHIETQFQTGKVDWHKLLKRNTYELEKKITIEALMAQLTEPTGKFFGYCPLLSDLCVIYDQSSCAKNLLCFWCNSNEICVSKVKSARILESENICGSLCPENYDLTGYMLKSVDFSWLAWPYSANAADSYIAVSNCKYFIPQFVFSLDFITPESKMFYHFFEDTLPYLYTNLLDNRDDIVFVYSRSYIKDIVEEFAEYFSIFSANCIMDVSTIAPNVCLKLYNHVREGNLVPVDNYILSSFGLNSLTIDRQAAPKFCLIRRLQKRFLLNRKEILQLARRKGYDAVELVFETMGVEEQLRAVRQCSILAGVHGSGLANGVFMNKGTVVIQIAPYKVCQADHFIPKIIWQKVYYLEWRNKKEENTVFHEHYLSDMSETDRLLLKSVPCATPGNIKFYEYWINQDTIVDLDDFAGTLREAQRLLDLTK